MTAAMTETTRRGLLGLSGAWLPSSATNISYRPSVVYSDCGTQDSIARAIECPFWVVNLQHSASFIRYNSHSGFWWAGSYAPMSVSRPRNLSTRK